MSGKTSELSVRELHEQNLLAIYAVAVDKDQARQLNPHRVQAKFLRTVFRFNKRFPGDSIGTRDAYGGARWEAREFQERIGAAMNVRSIEAGHGWYDEIGGDPYPSRFDGILNLKPRSS